MPEKDFDVFVIETEGKDLTQAIAAAWKTVLPSFNTKINDPAVPFIDDNFDECAEQIYKSDDAAFILAFAKRKNDKIWVVILSGSQDAREKRSSQISSCIGSLTIPGMKKEDLSQRPLKSIRANEAQLGQFITHAMRELQVPGLSIALVEDGKIVFERGYGVKKWGEQNPVNEHTLLKIGSISKSMTTLLMAKLVEEGRFGWRSKAQTLYPAFRVGDEALSKSLEMEQLASASTGLPRKDAAHAFNYRNKTIFQQLSATKPTTKPKETFQYNNQIVTAAGYIAAHTVYPEKSMDQAFCDVMSEKVFRPMGMARTTFIPQDNFAFPHSETIEGEVTSLTLQDDEETDFSKPAGGIWSSAHDMGLYVITELNGGVNARRERVFDEQTLKHRRTPQVNVGHNSSYGLGWAIDVQKGLTQIGHGGRTSGFASLLGFYPEKKCGFVMLTNGLGGDSLNWAIRRKLLELWFDTSEKSSETLAATLQELKKGIAENRKKLSAPYPDWISPFLGKHHNEELGFFDITQEKGGYFLDANSGLYKARLMTHEGHKGETTLACANPGGIRLIPIEVNSFKIMEAQHSYEFKKVAE